MIEKFYHYAHALESRLFQLYELALMRREGVDFSTDFRKKIWRNPGQTEDWINLARFIKPSEKVILVDIGANVGDFTADFLSIYKNGRAFCFEPVQATFDQLTKKFSAEKRVVLERCGLGDVDGDAEIFLDEQSTLSSFCKY